MFRRVCLGLLVALLALETPASAQERQPAPGYNVQPPFGPPGLERNPASSGYNVQPSFGWPASTQGRNPAPPGYNVQPLDRILPGVRNGRPGRFFDAEGPYPDPTGGWHYRIKWLTPEGRVIWLDTDARTGRVIGPSSGYRPGFMMPPSGLRYYRYPGPMPGTRGRFGGWRRGGGWRPGGMGFGGRRR